MALINEAIAYLKNFGIYFTTIGIKDVIEIILVAALLFVILAWMKNTRAWSLLKGVFLIAIFLLIAYFFKMQTIMWLAKNVFSFAAIALIVVLQPELRKALEELGKKNIIGSLMPFESMHRSGESMTDKAISELVKGCVEMGKVRTGALIVIERSESVKEFESTGIPVDAVLTSQLLINIFEKNTPLHDGAVIVRGNRITSATCYLPLSDSLTVSKELGTRHRAGLGVSERTDSATIIVSEETGRIALALDGKLERNLDYDSLTRRLKSLMADGADETHNRKKIGRRTSHNA